MMSAKAAARSPRASKRPPYWRVFKDASPQLLNIFVIFFVSLSIFPALHSGNTPTKSRVVDTTEHRSHNTLYQFISIFSDLLLEETLLTELVNFFIFIYVGFILFYGYSYISNLVFRMCYILLPYFKIPENRAQNSLYLPEICEFCIIPVKIANSFFFI